MEVLLKCIFSMRTERVQIGDSSSTDSRPRFEDLSNVSDHADLSQSLALVGAQTQPHRVVPNGHASHDIVIFDGKIIPLSSGRAKTAKKSIKVSN